MDNQVAGTPAPAGGTPSAAPNPFVAQLKSFTIDKWLYVGGCVALIVSIIITSGGFKIFLLDFILAILAGAWFFLALIPQAGAVKKYDVIMPIVLLGLGWHFLLARLNWFIAFGMGGFAGLLSLLGAAATVAGGYMIYKKKH